MTLTTKQMKMLALCKSAIESIDAAAEVVLYGSRARGDATEESDYDLLIISDSQATIEAEDRLRRALYDIQLETASVITVLMVNRDQWGTPLSKAMPLHQNIERDGIAL
jgi:predicted nucleotidyltransferase